MLEVHQIILPTLSLKRPCYNDDPKTHEFTVMLFDSGVKEDLNSVKLNNNEVVKNAQGTIASSDQINPGLHKVIIDVYNFYNDRQTFESQIMVHSDPSFFLKLADDVKGIKTSVTQNYTASIHSSSYVGFDINSANSQYEIAGVAYVEGENGEKSKEYAIANDVILSRRLLLGDFTNFQPVKLILAITFSYNGQLSSSLKGGYIRRTYEVKQEIAITNEG